MEPGGSNSHLQGLSNNPYRESNQRGLTAIKSDIQFLVEQVQLPTRDSYKHGCHLLLRVGELSQE